MTPIDFTATEPMGAAGLLARLRALATKEARNAAAFDPVFIAEAAALSDGEYATLVGQLGDLGVKVNAWKMAVRVQKAGEKEQKRPTESSGPGWMSELKRDGDTNKIYNHPANAVIILQHDEEWRDVLAYDAFRDAVVFRKPPRWYDVDAPAPRENDRDNDVLDDFTTPCLANWLFRRYDLSLSPEAVYTAASTVARSKGRAFNSLRDWLEGLHWDGVDRVGGPDGSVSWLSTYLGAIDSSYTRHVGRWWLISAVARAFKPGCQVDHMLILEGGQGAGKSSSLRALFGSYMSETQLDLHSKDRFVGLRGVWCQSFDELAGMSRSDENVVKGFITSVEDRYRPPYGRGLVGVPRRCVFAGTVNPKGSYLKDESGNRRYWPVRCVNAVDADGIANSREQIWAQAVVLFKAHERWYPQTEVEKALCRIEQEGRADADVWFDCVRDWLAGQYVAHRDGADPRTKGIPYSVSTAEILDGSLGIKAADQGKDRAPQRIAGIMTSLGWLSERRTRGGKRDSSSRWYPPEAVSVAEEIVRMDREEAAHRQALADIEKRRAKLCERERAGASA